jgi:nucleoid-associated protein YgaU
MKINAFVVFTTLTVVAGAALAYVVLRPAQIAPPVAEIAASVAQPEAPKPETKVAVAAEPVKPVDPAPSPMIEPSFDTVRVETGGEAVIAGRAEPGTEVVAKLDGSVVAKTITSADGSFVMIPEKPLPAGAGTLSLETNKGGAVQVSTTKVAVAVKPQGQGESTVAVMTPDQPTKILQAPASPDNAVVLDAVDYNAAGDIVFSGRALPGASVRLYVDNVITGEVKADDAGKWSYSGTSAVIPGTHTLRADAIAVDGTVSSRVEVPFLREAPAKIAEVQPAPQVAPAAVAVVPTPTPVAEPTSVTKAEPAPALVVTTPAAPQPTRIVIQPGNNLWTISRELYGYGRNYTVIYEANKDQIRNPRLIYPGQIITAPVAEKTP